MDDSGAEAAADEVDWAAVRAAYEAGEVPLSRIYAEHGLTRGRLQYRRQVEGWKARPQVAQSSRPTRMRRPVEAAILLIARLMEAHIERLLAVPAGETMPPPLPDEELREIREMGQLLQGLADADSRRRLARRAGGSRSSAQAAVGGGRGKISVKPAMDGGHRTEEEARAADEAFMRAELKRRTDVLAAALERGEISLDRRDEGGVAPAEA